MRGYEKLEKKIETLEEAMHLIRDYCPEDCGLENNYFGNCSDCCGCWTIALEKRYKKTYGREGD